MRFFLVLVVCSVSMLPAMLWAGPAIVYTGSVYDDTYSYSVHRGIQIFQGKSGKKIHEVESAPDGSKYVDDVLRCIEQGYSPIVFPYSGQFPEIMDLAWTYERLISYSLTTTMIWNCPTPGFFPSRIMKVLFWPVPCAHDANQNRGICLRGWVSGISCVFGPDSSGVHAVNPDIRIVYGVLEDRPGVWRDAEQGGETAAELMAQGADILFAAADLPEQEFWLRRPNRTAFTLRRGYKSKRSVSGNHDRLHGQAQRQGRQYCPEPGFIGNSPE